MSMTMCSVSISTLHVNVCWYLGPLFRPSISHRLTVPVPSSILHVQSSTFSHFAAETGLTTRTKRKRKQNDSSPQLARRSAILISRDSPIPRLFAVRPATGSPDLELFSPGRFQHLCTKVGHERKPLQR